MPRTRVILYREEDGTCPFLDWLDDQPIKARAKCLLRIERLQEQGHELRRPAADLLRDAIHELRASYQGINYRILYFFYGSVAAVVSHGIVKEGRVPPIEIDRAIQRKKLFELDPSKHGNE